MFVCARGRGQVADSFAMIRLALGLSEAELAGAAWCSTVINTNSSRQIDKPMAEGIIDFARAGQMSIITPFCLAGAMAPAVADLSNRGTWEAAGARTSTGRATAIWQRLLADFTAPPGAEERGDRIAALVARRTGEGGASPPD